jgi:hypothetical protein
LRAALGVATMVICLATGCGNAMEAGPTPVLLQLIPDSVDMGIENVITLVGSGFTTTSVVNVSARPSLTTFLTDKSLETVLAATDVEVPGSVHFTVTNPPPGGGQIKLTNLMLQDSRITGADGRIYTTSGSVIEAARHKKVGSFETSYAHAIHVDPELGRIFILDRGVGIQVFDVNTFQLLGVVPVLAGGGLPDAPLIRWSTDGFAFIQSGYLKIVRSHFCSMSFETNETH